VQSSINFGLYANRASSRLYIFTINLIVTGFLGGMPCKVFFPNLFRTICDLSGWRVISNDIIPNLKLSNEKAQFVSCEREFNHDTGLLLLYINSSYFQ
jgi:hypothetical protein